MDLYIIWLVVLGAIGALFWWATAPSDPNAPRASGVGSAAVGTVYDLLNEEKRKAVEIIVEQRAEARDPESVDGNLPDLESPDKKPR